MPYMRIGWLGAVFACVLAACGGGETVAAHLPEQPPLVRIQVAVPSMYQGLPLTVTAEPLPMAIDASALGQLPNQYEFDLQPSDLQYGTFQVLSYNPQTHTGMIVGDVDLTAELVHFDTKKNGTPTIVAFLMVTSSASAPSQVVAPRIDRVVVEWKDGTQSTYVYS